MRIVWSLSAIVLIVISIYLVYLATSSAWEAIISVDDKLALAIVAGFFSIVGAATTVTLGRFFERKKEIEAHFREKKIKIYDEFLVEFFKVFHGDLEDSPSGDDHLVDFLKEWQRTLILWGGRKVLKSYIKLMSDLKSGGATAKTMFLMDELFRSIRSDIGLSSFGLVRGEFSHFILTHADLLLDAAKQNPNISLEELSELEKKLESQARART